MKRSINIIFILVFIILIVSCFNFYNIVHTNNDFFSGIYGSLLTSLITVLLIGIAYVQLKNISETTNADFIHKLKNDFFKTETRNLFHLIEHDYILFRKTSKNFDETLNDNCICEKNKLDELNSEYFFEVDSNKIKNSGLPEEIQDLLLQKKFYSSFELDDFLLGHFEDVGLFEERGIIDIEMVYEEFSWYLKATYENCQIKQYLDTLGSDFYDKFRYIYEKTNAYGRIKEAKTIMKLSKAKF